MASGDSEQQKMPLLTLALWLIAVRASDLFHFFDEFDVPAAQAGWIATLLAGVWAGLGTALAYGLYRSFPGRPLTQVLEERLGRVVGKGINVVLAWFLLHEAAISLRSLTDAVDSAILSRTPPVAVSAALALVVVFAARAGIEVIGRSVIPVTVAMFLAVGLIVVLIMRDVDVARLMPVLGPGWGAIAASSFYIASLSTHLVLLPVFLGFTETSRRTGWVLQAQNALVHLFIAANQALVVAAMSFAVSRNKVFEFLSLARYVSVGEFLERIDPLLLAGWVATSYAAIAAFFLASLMAAQAALGLKDYRPLTCPFGVLLVFLSRILFDNIRERTAFVGYAEAANAYRLLFIFVLPLLLWPLLYWRRRAPARGAP